ncbi:MAG TPA: glycosyltransferase family A protein [Lachnospiraceae bacterium]|nr:glycosyltransferase family A protein [Lachnospiraceae bacterium]
MLLTVFTPTYNRKELLRRVYDSLLQQTSQDFCWLIVDDGSKDCTGDEVRKWIADAEIPIQYVYRENGGKMRAHNTGVERATTELFICVDSDDYLAPDAVEQIVKAWEEVRARGNQENTVAGIVAHKGKSLTETLSGSEFPRVEYSTLRELYQGGFHGETTLVFKTDILKKYPFPEINGEKYVPEDYIYDKIDRDYVLRVLPHILTICELVESGYTDSVQKLRDENPQAWYLYYEQRVQITPMSILKIKYISHYLCFARCLKKKVFSESKFHPGLILLGMPGAWMLRLFGKK